MQTKIDIIILSYAKNEELKRLTVQTIDTLLASEDSTQIAFNILVIESNKTLQPYQFEHTTTIYPNTEFGFNKYLNIGINATGNNYVCLCNNDLIFHKGWASALLKTATTINNEHWVLSPFCELQHRNFADLKEPVEGYFEYFAGYCFFTNRETLKLVGPLDERINFWYADMDFLELMSKYNILHYLVPESRVSHITSQVTIGFSKLEQLKYTYYPSIYFRYKWKDKSILLYVRRMVYYWVRYIFYYFKNLLA